MPAVTKTLGEGTQAVLLTVAILEALAADRRPVSVTELARTIGTSKSRVFRHLRTLLACAYVRQDEAGGDYAIGPRLLALCRSTSSRYDLGRMAAPAMKRLSEIFPHSVIVSRIEPEGVRVIASLSSRGSIVLEVRPESILSFERSAQGRLALAFAPTSPEEAGSAMATARSRVPAGDLRAIRERGIATAQMREGLMGMAAPIFGADGQLVGTLALLNTMAEMQRRDAETTLREAALGLSRQLGFQPPPLRAEPPSRGTPPPPATKPRRRSAAASGQPTRTEP